MIAKIVIRYGWAAWVGGMMSQAGWPVWSWQFWVAMVPLSFLVIMSRKEAVESYVITKYYPIYEKDTT